ncbi:hypothetical protein DL89DRAFT_71323 [Linderina pennispora]|uniref:Uncharacterized protein n=1 Tax=Linderina pennispora TaxID=61395 RepID=A0A1Y1VQZ4_9FUNG|nr:uncharacterized protein DL89DRAFT_71323 [Linderina pennispora]ORX63708.1 hypothetical protein DL89DRAFT_71323 [Linderina pennispora]
MSSVSPINSHGRNSNVPPSQRLADTVASVLAHSQPKLPTTLPPASHRASNSVSQDMPPATLGYPYMQQGNGAAGNPSTAAMSFPAASLMNPMGGSVVPPPAGFGGMVAPTAQQQESLLAAYYQQQQQQHQQQRRRQYRSIRLVLLSSRSHLSSSRSNRPLATSRLHIGGLLVPSSDEVFYRCVDTRFAHQNFFTSALLFFSFAVFFPCKYLFSQASSIRSNDIDRDRRQHDPGAARKHL